MTGRGAVVVRGWSIVLAVVAVLVGGVLTLVGIGSPPDGDFGDIGLPGSTGLRLPAGRVELTFTEDVANQTLDIPAELHIAITPAGGGSALPVVRVPDGDTVGIDGVSHVYWGYVDVPAGGAYDVTVPDAIPPSIPNPHLLFGPESWPFRWLLFGGGVAVAFVFAAVVAHRAARKDRATTATD